MTDVMFLPDQWINAYFFTDLVCCLCELGVGLCNVVSLGCILELAFIFNMNVLDDIPPPPPP